MNRSQHESPVEQLMRISRMVQAHLPPYSAICGGWSLDMGSTMMARAHKDIDISIQRRHQLDAQAYFVAKGWTLEIAHDGKLSAWEEGVYLEPPYHTIWCKHKEESPDFLELQLDDGDDEHFIYRRDTVIKRVWSKAIQVTDKDGMPFLAPEITLLYKSKTPDDSTNQFDFERMKLILSDEQNAWLQKSIRRLYVEHPWLES